MKVKTHPTKRAVDWRDSARLTSIFLASGFSCSQTLSTPARQPLTQTVSLRLAARSGLALAGVKDSGYNLARMRYEIILAPQAVEDLHNLKANVRAVVRDAIEEFLRHQPTKTSKARIKRLRGLSRPQYRLRVEDVRVFYDVSEESVEILAIVPKSEAAAWLNQIGDSDEEDRTI